MSAEPLVRMQRSYTIDESTFVKCPSSRANLPDILPFSISAFETVPRVSTAASQYKASGRTTCDASPFCSAIAEIGTVLASTDNTQLQHLPVSPCNEFKGMDSIAQLSSTFSSVPTYGGMQTCGGPPHGVKAVCGKRAKMEDAYAVQTNFYDLPAWRRDDVAEDKLPARFAAQTCGCPMRTEHKGSKDLVPTSPSGQLSLGSSTRHRHFDSGDMLHFYGVYDGHGGVEAANHCANRLHHHLSEALSMHSYAVASDLLSGPQSPALLLRSHENGTDWVCCDEDEHMHDAAPMPTVLQPSDAVAPMASRLQRSCNIGKGFEEDCGAGCGFSGHASGDSVGTSLEAALREAFLRTDAEFGADSSAASVGSTAVVAVVGKEKIWIGNCGDSRAVLCRGGTAVQLTDDHKPERQDETERVEKAGGHVLFWNGHRVMGILAMSRAIGDHGLRPYVIPEPEISIITRSAEDDFLLLASDGLWDVMSNQETTDLASRCLVRALEKGVGRKAAVRIAASVLTKAAIDRGSKDNVTVVIVDMKQQEEPALEVTTAPAGTLQPS